ncbi:hypothetical protein BMS3Bbin04_00015 [bacterium BMS3Bbin04]|nr:hypothetical protein BMS3Bbin04_00015 [bacterium BMS3Bbin04]
MPEKQKRSRATNPFSKIFLQFSNTMLVFNLHSYFSCIQYIFSFYPNRLRKSGLIEADGQGRSKQHNIFSKTERALETDTSKSNRMKGTLV